MKVIELLGTEIAPLVRDGTLAWAGRPLSGGVPLRALMLGVGVVGRQ